MLKIGVLGAARITRDALIKPARKVDGVEVVAITVRDRQRVADAASKHNIPNVFDSYEAMLADGPNVTDSAAAVETMQTIDDIYLAAGMEVRLPS